MTTAFQSSVAVTPASRQTFRGRALCTAQPQNRFIAGRTLTKRRTCTPTMRMYDVEINLDGTTHKLSIHEEQTILEGIESHGLEVLHSCRAGVCVTCAAKLLSGEIDPGFAAITEDLKDDGYVLTCSAFPRSDGIKLEMNQFDAAYKRQYGQYELDS